MRLKLTILLVEVTPLLKLKSRRKGSNSVVSYSLLIWLEVRELRTVRAITRIDKLKVQKSTSPYSASKNAFVP